MHLATDAATGDAQRCDCHASLRPRPVGTEPADARPRADHPAAIAGRTGGGSATGTPAIRRVSQRPAQGRRDLAAPQPRAMMMFSTALESHEQLRAELGKFTGGLR